MTVGEGDGDTSDTGEMGSDGTNAGTETGAVETDLSSDGSDPRPTRLT